MAALVLALIYGEVLYLRVVNFDFLKVILPSRLILHNILHVLNFGLFVLVAQMMMHRVTDGRTGATFVNREYKFIAFAVDFGNNMILLRIILPSF